MANKGRPRYRSQGDLRRSPDPRHFPSRSEASSGLLDNRPMRRMVFFPMRKFKPCLLPNFQVVDRMNRVNPRCLRRRPALCTNAIQSFHPRATGCNLLPGGGRKDEGGCPCESILSAVPRKNTTRRGPHTVLPIIQRSGTYQLMMFPTMPLTFAAVMSSAGVGTGAFDRNW